jgi:hypothetical protein
MNTETVLARILPAREEAIKAVVSQGVASSTPATLYDLEEQTQAVLPRIGQVLLQGVVTAQGAGVVGPTRSCPCGADQHDHDQARQLSVQTSVGQIQLKQRAVYQCSQCAATSYPPDRAVGAGPSRPDESFPAGTGWLASGCAARPHGRAAAGAFWLACGGGQSDSSTWRGSGSRVGAPGAGTPDMRKA